MLLRRRGVPRPGRYAIRVRVSAADCKDSVNALEERAAHFRQSLLEQRLAKGGASSARCSTPPAPAGSPPTPARWRGTLRAMTRVSASAVAAVALFVVVVTAACSDGGTDTGDYVAAFDNARRSIAAIDGGSDGLVTPEQMADEQRRDARELTRIAAAFGHVQPPRQVALLHRRFVVAIRRWGENLERVAELAGRSHGVDARLRRSAERFYRADDELWAAVDEWPD